MCTRQRNLNGIAVATGELRLIALVQGEFAHALQLNIAALGHFESLGSPHGTLESLEWIAVSLAASIFPNEAMMAYGAATAARDHFDVDQIDNEAMHRDAGNAVAVRTLGEAVEVAAALMSSRAEENTVSV